MPLGGTDFPDFLFFFLLYVFSGECHIFSTGGEVKDRKTEADSCVCCNEDDTEAVSSIYL